MIELINENTIKLSKEINDLDKFVLDFVNILKKHTNYIIISGFISILFGRSRGTEDVDIIIPKVDKTKWIEINLALLEKFECLNCNDPNEVYSYLSDGLSVRFAKKGEIIPNMELKFAKYDIDHISLNNKIKVLIDNNELFIGPIELQIVYKKKILKSNKDLEDAKHLEIVLKKVISQEKIKYYDELVKELWKKRS
ncbi:hypothetical protein HZA97_06090 [Candidatus Woesearchaeota archaeon]|nr:hypothetical protein [Candidatus Woesearchaeota archaeon]